MASKAQGPSQAARLEAVADATVAGPGATDKNVTGDPFSGDTAMNSSPDSLEAAAEQDGVEKPQGKPEAPQRSTLKIALIMGSLCVSFRTVRFLRRAFY